MPLVSFIFLPSRCCPFIPYRDFLPSASSFLPFYFFLAFFTSPIFLPCFFSSLRPRFSQPSSTLQTLLVCDTISSKKTYQQKTQLRNNNESCTYARFDPVIPLPVIETSPMSSFYITISDEQVLNRSCHLPQLADRKFEDSPCSQFST